MTLKWVHPLNMVGGYSRSVVQGADGALFLAMEHTSQFGCLNPDGTLRWLHPYNFHGDAVVSLLVTPQGEVVVQSELGEIIAVRAETPGPDMSIVWQQGPRSPPVAGSPGLTDETPHIFVASGGFVFLKQPFGGRLDLFDRCGHWHWSLENMIFYHRGASVLGAEFIAPGQSVQEYWAHFVEDPIGLTSDRLWAVHVDGRMQEIAAGVRGRPVLGLGLGGGLLLASSVEESGLGVDRELLHEFWWVFRRDGSEMRSFAVDGPPWPSATAGSVASTRVGNVVTTAQDGRMGWPQMVVLAYAMDGDVVWQRDDLFPAVSYAGFVVGRDERVVVVGLGSAGTPPASTQESVVIVLDEGGAEEHRATIREAAVTPGTRLLLAMDGTLYFLARSGGRDVLVAVQTPVPGPQPEDTGWLRPVGRTPAADWWAP